MHKPGVISHRARRPTRPSSPIGACLMAELLGPIEGCWDFGSLVEGPPHERLRQDPYRGPGSGPGPDGSLLQTWAQHILYVCMYVYKCICIYMYLYLYGKRERERGLTATTTLSLLDVCLARYMILLRIWDQLFRLLQQAQLAISHLATIEVFG